jgi:diguanylate cyclase (GGDEF)-like protein
MWVRLLLCLVLVQTAASIFLPKSYLLTGITDCIILVLMVSASVAFGRNARTSHRRQRIVWILLSVGYAIESLAQVGWTYGELVRKETPSISAGDGAVFLAWTLLILGFALRPHVEPTDQQRHLGKLDLLILLLAGLYLYLFLVVPWGYIAPDPQSYGVSYKFLALAQDFILLSLLALGWKQSSAEWRKFYLLLSLIVAIDTVMEYVVDSLAETGVYFSGGWYDCATAICLAGMTLAALVAQGLAPVAGQGDSQSERYWRLASRLASPVSLILPVLTAWSFLDDGLPADVRRFRVLLSLLSIVVFVFIGITKQARLENELAGANRELLDASLTDVLTGVRNRRFFTNSIDSDVRQVLRSFAHQTGEDVRNRDLIFYLIDVDNFKKVNDQFGHQIGDQVLVEIARRINSAARLSDVVIRWGGEEFLLVSRQTDRANAHILAQRVLDAVGLQPCRFEGVGNHIHVTCSVGWAAFPWSEKDPNAKSHDQVLLLADSALYQAKDSGRNRGVGLLPAANGSVLNANGIPTSSVTILGPHQKQTAAAASK